MMRGRAAGLLPYSSFKVGARIELKAQNMAGYIETKSRRLVVYALMVNDAGAIEDIATDVSGVTTDEARISSIIYENL
jgi:hypothetical protein